MEGIKRFKAGDDSEANVGYGTQPVMSGGINPLFNSVVLANTFGYCPLQDLKSCRQVCRTWDEESRQLWRSSVTIHFPSYGTSLSDFLDFWERDDQVKPYRKFHLKGWSFGPVIKEARKLFVGGETHAERFLRCVGQTITCLTLDGCTFARKEEFGAVIFNSSPNLQSLKLTGTNTFADYGHDQLHEPDNFQLDPTKDPIFGTHKSLKSLTVELVDGDTCPYFPMTWLQFLCHFPHLEALKLEMRRGFTLPHTVKVLLCTLYQIRVKGVRLRHGWLQLPLKEFELANCYIQCSTSYESRTSLQMFRLASLPFRLLNIILDPFLEENQLKGTLRLHSKYLTEIFARNSPTFSELNSPRWGFPFGIQLDNLDRLTMVDGFCQNLGFLKFTPNLRSLEIDQPTIRLTRMSRGPPPRTALIANTCPVQFAEVKLQKLKSLFFGYTVSNNDMMRLMGWFPNVEVLTMALDDSQFSLVCQTWRGLLHLHVLGGGVGDEGVTGARIRLPSDRKQRGIEGMRRPNITLLNDLTCFEMERMRSALSDTSAFTGFLKMPNLRRLSIVSETNNFGEKAVNALESQIPECHLKTCAGVASLDKRISCDTGLPMNELRREFIPNISRG